MEVSDINFMEQQLKAQFEMQKEVYDAEIRCLKEKCKQLQKELDELDNVQKGKLLKRIDEDRQIILDYDNDLRKANTKLDRTQDIVSDELNLKFDVTGKLKEIEEIIGG